MTGLLGVLIIEGRLNCYNYSYTKQIEMLPEEIGELKELVTLDIAYTNIKAIPPSVKNLSLLQYLFINDTLIEEIPSWINKDSFPKLEVLTLSSLKIRCLPKEIMSFGLEFKGYYQYESWDKGIFIKNLSLATQPVSLFLQSRDLIQNYYNSDKVDLKESKVIFMGDGGAGKSYTIQRIKNNGEKLKNDTDVTHDIVIESWDNRANIVDYDGSIDFWDFGGQDIYLSMHRCFLTERSCYVIVLSNRQSGSHRGLMGQARYWLKNISAFAVASPILIAINTWKGLPRDGLSLTQLKSEFPELSIVDQIVYDAHDPSITEFNRLTTRICKMAQENYSYDLQFPISWNNIRTRLLNEYNNEDIISEARYYQICEEEMTAHEGHFDREIARWLLQWFNDLGYCFSYHDIDGSPDGEEYQVLEPRWVIRAMYRIINYKLRRSADDNMPRTESLPQDLADSPRISEGRVAKAEVIDLLIENPESGGGYTKDNAEYIIRILRKFKLAYLIYDSKSEYLFIPALCSDIRPDTFDEISPDFELNMEYLVRFRYLPDTVMQHLMIKCYQRLLEVWKNGFHIDVRAGIIVVEMCNDIEIVIKYYAHKNSIDYYGLHEIRTWLTEVYNELGIENTRDFIVKRTMHQTAFINVTALVAAYIVNPQLKVYYTQDDDIYLGHSVDDLLKGLYGSNYPEIIKAEMVRRKGHDVKKSTIPEELSKQYKCSHIAGVLEERFRSQFRYHNPANEPEVQKRLQEFLDALGYRSGEDYDREMGAFKFSGREYIPDFVFWKLNAVLEVKFVDSKAKKSKIITEMSDDCSAYPKVYDYIIFLVYDDMVAKSIGDDTNNKQLLILPFDNGIQFMNSI